MVTEIDSIYLVNAYSDPVIIKFRGRASYLNCSPLMSFFKKTIEAGNIRFVVDFDECIGIDSTVLGILAGIGLKLRKASKQGTMNLVRLNPRNLELVKNLGLHRIMNVVEGDLEWEDPAIMSTLSGSQAADQALMLKAHKALIEAEPENIKKFQDVIAFLQIKEDQQSED